ncbi:MAG: hypothetical protein Q4C89_10855, partial [Deinococcus sp.]|uniref:hypothetical protein n=1 Tax=Deinococcus sp. TaxID=47478 RepID=UPI0026DD647D
PRVLVGLVALSFSYASAQTTERPLMVRPPQMQTAETQAPQVQLPQTAPSLPAAAPAAVPVYPAAGRVVPSAAAANPVPVVAGPVNGAVGTVNFRPVRFQVVNAGLVRQALSQQSGGLVVRPRALAPFNPLQLPPPLATSW